MLTMHCLGWDGVQLVFNGVQLVFNEKKGELASYHQKDHMFGNLPLKDCLFAI
jgi:hypothetical protein